MYDATEANGEVKVQLQAILTSTAPRRIISLGPRPPYVEERHDIHSMQYSWVPKDSLNGLQKKKTCSLCENTTLIGGCQAQHLVTRCNR